MRECLHRARAKEISLKNVASTPTFSLSNGDFRWQTTALDLSQYFHRQHDARISYSSATKPYSDRDSAV